MKVSIENNTYDKKGRNLYEKDGVYYRLFAHSKSDNGCWLINPVMQELKDIRTATGEDVYGSNRIVLECCGTVPARLEFITTEHVTEQTKILEEKYGPLKRSGWKSIPGIPAELF